MSLVPSHKNGLEFSEGYRSVVANFDGRALPTLYPPVERRDGIDWLMLEDTGNIKAVCGRREMPKRLGGGLLVLVSLMGVAFAYGAFTR